MGQQSSNQASGFDALESGGMGGGMGGVVEGGQSEAQELTWWCRILIKIIAAIAGIVGFITGIIAMLSLSICILAGIIQVLVSILLLIFELPFCCTFAEITKPIASFAERRTFFQKAIIYGGLAIIPVVMCISPSTLIGCALIFANAVFYGLLALGKKADRSVMIARASGDKSDLISNDQLSSGATNRPIR